MDKLTFLGRVCSGYTMSPSPTPTISVRWQSAIDGDWIQERYEFRSQELARRWLRRVMRPVSGR